MKEPRKCWLVIGCIDAYGAIHTRKVFDDERNYPDHSTLWPNVHHKRFRFKVSDWELSNSPLSGEKLSAEDADNVLARMKKIVTPPHWVLQGEAWEAAGRPTRDSRKGKAFFAKWEKEC